MIRVLLADDHAIVRAGLRRLLADTGDILVVGEASDGVETLELLAQVEVDVVVLDLNMPRMTGLDALQEIRRVQHRVRVLVLTMYPEEQYALRVFQAGGDGFLSKSSVTEELILAIRRVAAERKYVTPSVAEHLAEHLGAAAPPVPYPRLSKREIETLRLIAAGRTTGAIAMELGVSAKTVGTFRYRLLRKLGLKSNVEAAHFAIESGLI